MSSDLRPARVLRVRRFLHLVFSVWQDLKGNRLCSVKAVLASVVFCVRLNIAAKMFCYGGTLFDVTMSGHYLIIY